MPFRHLLPANHQDSGEGAISSGKTLHNIGFNLITDWTRQALGARRFAGSLAADVGT
jgi:hypothetical protein